jgi:hypothetical protein
MRKTIIVTDCHHQYRTGWSPDRLAGATTDCRVCDALLIFPRETTVGRVVRARNFHVYLNETTDGWWPRDGHNTGCVEF